MRALYITVTYRVK